MKCRWKFIPPAATAAGNGHKSSVGSCLHRYFVIFYFLSPEFDGNKQGGDENDSFRLRERRRKRERERAIYDMLRLLSGPLIAERKRWARVCTWIIKETAIGQGWAFFFVLFFYKYFPSHTHSTLRFSQVDGQKITLRTKKKKL